MPFPQTRLRRLRATPVLRDLVRETRLDPGDFVLPLFVEEGLDGRAAIDAMPGADRLSIAGAVAEAGEAHALGIPAVLLFGIPAHKDEEGSGAWDDEGAVQLATRAIKDAYFVVLVIADHLDTTFHSIDDLRQFTRLPILASIPILAPSGRRLTSTLRVAA